VGRSNTGKSSLINMIFNKTKKDKTARVAKAQGTTKFLHFHEIKN
jgi:GTP-binding protein EngB required for normal cell division